jgi:hypothetical protein
VPRSARIPRTKGAVVPDPSSSCGMPEVTCGWEPWIAGPRVKHCARGPAVAGRPSHRCRRDPASAGSSTQVSDAIFVSEDGPYSTAPATLQRQDHRGTVACVVPLCEVTRSATASGVLCPQSGRITAAGELFFSLVDHDLHIGPIVVVRPRGFAAAAGSPRDAIVGRSSAGAPGEGLGVKSRLAEPAGPRPLGGGEISLK